MIKHNWVKNEKASSLYDTTYRCTKCKDWHTVSLDSIESNLPEKGCIPNLPSSLQQLSRQVVWMRYFFLKRFPMYLITRLNLSPATLLAIRRYNLAVETLKEQLAKDYYEHKRMILEIREERKELLKRTK